MDITLNFGCDGLALSLPDAWTVDVLEKHPMPVIEQPQSHIEQLLDHPSASLPLKALARGKRSACILICDDTRPVPNGLLLPPMIRRLLDAGIAAEEIDILVATGLHGPVEGSRLDALLGTKELPEKVKISNHYARSDEDHVPLQPTSSGIPVCLDRRFVEADLKLVTGLVEPHFMAGYSGGRKVIAPGICHEKTIRQLHAPILLDHPRASLGCLENNPLHEAQLEILHQLGDVYGISVVLNEQRQLCFADFGALEQGHARAVEFFRSYGEITVEKSYSTVLTSSAGDPLDRTYYQTVKAMVGAMAAVRPGGKIFVASACGEGVGSADYIEAQKLLVNKGLYKFHREMLQRPRAKIDEWQTQEQVKAMQKADVVLYAPGLDESQARLTGVEVVEDLEAAVASWVEQCGDERVAVVPEGPYVLLQPAVSTGENR